ncbi:hypothetical protein KAU33_16905, partial [Candidatus Dependentiae bacterium]|nr:hypothetical protein [Candidatus Dependentiae bacterium]
MGLFSSKEEKFQKAFNEGMDFYHQKEYGESIQEFKKALDYKDDSVECLYFLGSSYFRRDDKENALLIL